MTEPAITTHKTFCRFCHANCGIEVDVQAGVPVAIRGDADDPVYGGYTCMKGRELAAAHTHPDRLRQHLVRRADGGFAPIAASDAFDAIAAKLKAIIDQHGPRAVASYNGTYAFQNSSALSAALGFHKGIGSPSFYTSVTIDQPAKSYLWSRVGAWGGGFHSFKDADVVMIVGNNAIVSHYSPPGGIPPFSPSRRLRDAKARGLQVIVVDPRETEVAQQADQHLQPLPGEDAALLAGMLQVILDEGLHDQRFTQAYVDGLAELKAAVAPYTPEVVAARAGVPADAVVKAARTFGRAKRGIVTTGTGPEMAGHGGLVAHLVLALNYVCGRVYQEGEVSPVPRILTPGALPRRAEVAAPMPLYGPGFTPARVRGLTALGEEMPCAALADEILLPGEGQVKALIVVGGNPVVAWPNQEKTIRALKSLDLLVCIDNRISQTSRFADYVIAPQMCLERDDVTLLSEWWYEEPYGRYTSAIVEPQGDLVNEWEVFWELARRLGTSLLTAGGPTPMDVKPTTAEFFTLITAGSRVPVAEVKAATDGRGGAFFPEAAIVVEAGDPENPARLQLAPAEVIAELGAMVDERPEPGTFRLTSRRTKQFFNATGHDLPALNRKGRTNWAHMNPGDIAALGLVDGQTVELATTKAAIVGVVKASGDVRPGVISMAHGFGGWGDSEGTARGASTNILVDEETDYDPITGIPRMSAIPVRVRAVASAVAAE
jgi:anaerobic selenocysteine-containing dehydrogenase